MNFFEHQDRARGTTQKLVLLFSLAVASLVAITTLLVVFALGLVEGGTDPVALAPSFFISDVFLGVTVVVVGIVLLGAGFRMAQLRGGGHVVAEGLGGRLLQAGTQDADERRILNVVEEMAIAAGLPVPPVYLLEDDAINAFAAGFHQEDAVIGVTRGCIHILDRDELQGVVAHEFSHILNGDMRLNIRLIGWLYGIMVIGMIGYYVLRGSRYSGHAGRRRNGGGIIVLALGLVVVGYGGTFFGNLIKAAVSRQREYLADASAVQFTRNPDGIGGALKKIAAHAQGTFLRSADAAEVSHMLFGQGVKAGFTGLLSTHPPLAERIRRIDPGWNGALPQQRNLHAHRAADSEQSAPAAAVRQTSMDLLAASVLASVGEPGPAQVAQAAAGLAALPAALRRELQEPFGACTLMHALLLTTAAEHAQASLVAVLQQDLDPAHLAHLQTQVPCLRALPRTQYFMLVELAVPALKQLSQPQLHAFLATQQRLVDADGALTLFEWGMSRVLQRSLLPGRNSTTQIDIAHTSAGCAQLLSALAWAGADNEGIAARQAFSAAVEALGLAPDLLEPALAVQPGRLDAAMEQLRCVKPLQKPRLLKAMVASIAQDGRLRPVEAELLRSVALLLDCPLPPLPTLLLVAAPDAG